MTTATQIDLDAMEHELEAVSMRVPKDAMDQLFALIRVVRAAQLVADPAHAHCVYAAGYMDELQRALEPFKKQAA